MSAYTLASPPTTTASSLLPKPHRKRRSLNCFLALLLREANCATLYCRRWITLSWLTLTVMLLILVWLGVYLLQPADEAVLAAVRTRNPMAQELAKQLSYYGDFACFNVLVFLGFVLAGWRFRSRLLMRLAVACLLGASFSGLTANVARAVTGRPRPFVEAPDVLRGPTLSSDYHALPSAHAATSFGAALPVLMSAPVVGTPLSLAAVGIGWSRMQLKRHHASDVLASVMISLVYALPLSRWVRGLPMPPVRRHHRSRLPVPSHDSALSGLSS
jgi:membrane-associated phospholipid phosphatase